MTCYAGKPLLLGRSTHGALAIANLKHRVLCRLLLNHQQPMDLYYLTLGVFVSETILTYNFGGLTNVDLMMLFYNNNNNYYYYHVIARWRFRKSTFLWRI